MPRCGRAQRNRKFIAVVFDEQIQPCTVELALDQVVDDELDLTAASKRSIEPTVSAQRPRAAAHVE